MGPHPSELSTGNFVGVACGMLSEMTGTVMRIEDFVEGGVCAMLDYSDLSHIESESFGFDNLIPLVYERAWVRALGVPKDYLPEHIKYVHQVQQWYRWTKGKELDTSKVPIQNGNSIPPSKIKTYFTGAMEDNRTVFFQKL